MLYFFFNDTATTEIYTLSLHDALPIWCHFGKARCRDLSGVAYDPGHFADHGVDRMSRIGKMRSEEHTSELQSPVPISYAVFCLKKKKNQIYTRE